ncbi:MAG: hypothetical protein AB2565_07045 [Candidatus Thiodiazotropha endolucinida]|uniref:Uncharacterized protein n=1 Tax=Candidatus Thiodiazotropha endolucinida TaxID=1655433 RepID=A0A7Z0VKX0_9GAMM|nr:hypothetical protein [Candidatus Thiodiazotropha endolucinida]ODJ87389.1 hypothetical protein CODIS_23640 [Candidatus Thiodiazotropha endolucinida]
MSVLSICDGCLVNLSILIRDACDQQTNPYHLAGIGLYLADEWVNTLDGELEALRALRQPQP